MQFPKRKTILIFTIKKPESEITLSGFYILGFGTPHPKTADFIGDFFAVALGETNIDYKPGDFEMVGVHAGLTEEEMTVPFIAIKTEKRKRR